MKLFREKAQAPRSPLRRVMKRVLAASLWIITPPLFLIAAVLDVVGSTLWWGACAAYASLGNTWRHFRATGGSLRDSIIRG